MNYFIFEIKYERKEGKIIKKNTQITYLLKVNVQLQILLYKQKKKKKNTKK